MYNHDYAQFIDEISKQTQYITEFNLFFVAFKAMQSFFILQGN